MTCSNQGMALDKRQFYRQKSNESAARDSGYSEISGPDSARSGYSIDNGSCNGDCIINTSKNSNGVRTNGSKSRSRLDSNTSCLSNDSGHGSYERGRHDSENSNITLNDEYDNKSLSRAERNCNETDISTTPDSQTNNRERSGNSTIFIKCIDRDVCENNDNTDVSYLPKNKKSPYREDLSKASKDMNGNIYNIKEDDDETTSVKRWSETDHNTNTNKHRNFPLLPELNKHFTPKFVVSNCHSSPEETRHFSHRKCKSYSDSFTHEAKLAEQRAKTRKRFKSEGNDEENTPLQVQEQAVDLDVSSVKRDYVPGETKVLIDDMNYTKGNTNSKTNCNSKGSSESVTLLEVEEPIDHFADFHKDKKDFNKSAQSSCCKSASYSTASELELAGQDSVSVVKSCPDHLKARQVVESDHSIKPKINFDYDENIRNSLTVNVDKKDIDNSEENYGDSEVMVSDKMYRIKIPETEKSKSMCCEVCSGHYTEFYHRIDALTNDYQWLHKQTEEALKSARQLKIFLTRLAFFGLVLVLTVVCIIFTLVLVQNLTGRKDWIPEVFNKNITTRVAGLQEQYVDVSDMVNDLLTKTRPIIQLTNEGTPSKHGNSYYLTWTARGSLGQGGLGLSDRNDAIIAAAGGYYSICAKLYYNTRIENATNVKLEYDVIQRASGGGPLSVQHAIQVFPATSGPLRYELKSQTTAYIYPGDEIKISVGQDQLQYLADFNKAHELSMFEVS